jgi:integrase/recombinase XerD
MLSPVLLEALRDYWRGLKRKPSQWLFPGGCNHRADHPITPKTVYHACRQATRRAGLRNRVHPHSGGATTAGSRGRSGSVSGSRFAGFCGCG